VIENPDMGIIECATWNPFGTQLIISGKKLKMFELLSNNTEEEKREWKLMWQYMNPTPVCHITFLYNRMSDPFY
jgi:hypothetical protein